MKSQNQLLQGVLADALYANSAKAKRKAKKERKLLHVVTTNSLTQANTARVDEDDRWLLQVKAMRDANLSPADSEWKEALAAHKAASDVFLKHMGNIAED